MITIDKNQTRQIKLYLNQNLLNEESEISLVLSSPSRPTIELTKSLTKISTGFYSFDITANEGSQLVDNTYTYTIEQDERILKYGKVRRTVTELSNLVFDYTLDFTL